MQLSGISLAITRLGAMPWTPATLFAAGEVGVWYDPSDLTSMFQDAAGTIAAAVESPVGLILDKSGNGKHASQATAASRPTLKLIDGKYSLRFDGIDDSMSTASIDFSGGDKMTVVAGVRKLSDAATAVVCELSAIIDSNVGSFGITAPGVGGSIKFGLNYRGTTAGQTIGPNTTAFNAPFTAVDTVKLSISEDVAILRLNGTQAATAATDQGTGNFGNYPLYIGRRGGTSLPFNGHLYSLIVRGAQSTDAQIVAAETYVNGKTGAY